MIALSSVPLPQLRISAIQIRAAMEGRLLASCEGSHGDAKAPGGSSRAGPGAHMPASLFQGLAVTDRGFIDVKSKGQGGFPPPRLTLTCN